MPAAGILTINEVLVIPLGQFTGRTRKDCKPGNVTM